MRRSKMALIRHVITANAARLYARLIAFLKNVALAKGLSCQRLSCHVLTDWNSYIQELSNRVQQIESQAQAQEMRMSQLGALPVALRASLDAGDTSRMYTPEGYTSAPDDGDSLNQGQKRKFSELHDGQASSPFAQPRFVNNDRMPSLGGWPMNAQPSMNPTNQGHRNSISLAPDQTLDNIEMDSNRQETERPFWVQNTLKPPKSEPRTENVVGFPAVHHLVQEL